MSSGTIFLLALFAASAAYIAYFARQGAVWSAAALGFCVTALFTLSAGLIIRGLRANHWPLANRFEFALVWVWAILVFNLLSGHLMGTRFLGAFVLPIATLLALWAANRPEHEQTLRYLPPALQTMWFPLHVGASAIAYGAFSVAGGLGAMFLVTESLRGRGLIAASDTTRIPSLERIEYIIWRLVGLGFPWLTLGILAGAVWAQIAWGRYWDWDPKESWTLIIWLTYLILLHGRALQGWKRRRIAQLSLVGLGTVLFTYFGVDWLVASLRLESVHVF